MSISNGLKLIMHNPLRKMFQITRQAGAAWLLIMILLFSSSCGTIDISQPTPTPIADLTIDPIFREFYSHLGGEQVLGAPISAVLTEGAARIQFVQKAKMVFDPSRSIRQRFTLAPLGVEMGVNEPAVLPPEQPGFRYNGGHVIGPEFLPLYEKLGPYMSGKPLTEVRYNPIRRRHEQFFESVGFYRLEGSDQVHLLNYGVWACESELCPNNPGSGSSDADIDQFKPIDPTFVQFVNQMGADFTGFAISQPYVNSDGNWEQIFENVVLQANSPNDPTSVTIRPLTERLNIPPDPPREKSSEPDWQFYGQDGERGYDIPDYFWQFLKTHGGLELSGPPVTHLSPLDGAVLHQCFENLCLMYDQQAPPPGRVRPEPIGYSYKTLYHRPEPAAVQGQPRSDLQVSVWERFPYVSPGHEQEVGISVMRNNLPLAGVQPTLVLTLLDGNEMAVPMPVTDDGGHSSLRLAPIQGPSGSLVQYEICLPLPVEQETCKEDSFVLWNTP